MWGWTGCKWGGGKELNGSSIRAWTDVDNLGFSLGETGMGIEKDAHEGVSRSEAAIRMESENFQEGSRNGLEEAIMAASIENARIEKECQKMN